MILFSGREQECDIPGTNQLFVLRGRTNSLFHLLCPPLVTQFKPVRSGVFALQINCDAFKDPTETFVSVVLKTAESCFPVSCDGADGAQTDVLMMAVILTATWFYAHI